MLLRNVVARNKTSQRLLILSTSVGDERIKYYAVKEADKASAKSGDQIGGSVVRSGYTTSRRGRRYGSLPYISCCGLVVYSGFSEEYYSFQPCTRGKDGMYHPGNLIPYNRGSRSRGGGTDEGPLRWSCCRKDVTTCFDEPPQGCTALEESVKISDETSSNDKEAE